VTRRFNFRPYGLWQAHLRHRPGAPTLRRSPVLLPAQLCHGQKTARRFPGGRMNLPTHRLSRAQFDAFCAGAVDTELMTAIRDGQYSRRRLLLSALVDAAAGKLDASGPLESAEQAWQILVTADDRNPDVVEDVVMSPSVGVWLTRAARRLRDVDLDGPSLWVELGYLHSLAAAVAVRTRQPCIIGLPVIHGAVTLPTVGQIRFQGNDRTGFVSLHVSGKEVALRPLRDGGQFELRSMLAASEFVPVRRHEVVRVGARLNLELDDATPYRLFSTPQPPHPLGREEIAGWRADLDGAWDALTRWHPQFAAELSAGLAMLAPISSPSRVIGASASAAFGGVAASRADSPVSLAATLVHELQHSKLNALLDLIILHTRDPTELSYVPWRDDPRPLTALLHGIYAFTSTIEFWHVQRQWRPEPASRQATFSFTHRHMQVRAAIDSVRSAPDLTELGAQLVESAAQRLARCTLDDVSWRDQ
jgi:HEXXH motif-containing protein